MESWFTSFFQYLCPWWWIAASTLCTANTLLMMIMLMWRTLSSSLTTLVKLHQPTQLPSHLLGVIFSMSLIKETGNKKQSFMCRIFMNLTKLCHMKKRVFEDNKSPKKKSCVTLIGFLDAIVWKVDVYSVILVQVQAQLEEGKQVHYLKVKWMREQTSIKDLHSQCYKEIVNS